MPDKQVEMELGPWAWSHRPPQVPEAQATRAKKLCRNLQGAHSWNASDRLVQAHGASEVATH